MFYFCVKIAENEIICKFFLASLNVNLALILLVKKDSNLQRKIGKKISFLSLKHLGLVHQIVNTNQQIDRKLPQLRITFLYPYSNDITFSNVYFTYPARPNVSILNGLSLKIQVCLNFSSLLTQFLLPHFLFTIFLLFGLQKGETVALVGSSGCGKSTCIQMMQRFYDPDQGQIFLGQHDLKGLFTFGCLFTY